MEVRRSPLNNQKDRRKGALMVCASKHQAPNQTRRTGAKNQSCDRINPRSKYITLTEFEKKRQKPELFVGWKCSLPKRKLEFWLCGSGTHPSPNNFILVYPSKKLMVLQIFLLATWAHLGLWVHTVIWLAVVQSIWYLSKPFQPKAFSELLKGESILELFLGPDPL